MTAHLRSELDLSPRPAATKRSVLRDICGAPLRTVALMLMVCLVAALPAAAQPPGIPNQVASSLLPDKMDAEIEEHFDEKKLPGLVVLYARDGMLTYKKTLGHADVANDVKMTEHRVGRLNSVSKWVAGIISLQQVEKGNLNLMSSAKTYVPDLPAHHTYNIRDLLACRSGVRHYGETTSPDSPSGWSNNHFDTALDAAPMFWLDPLASLVGWYHYSTPGYTILGAALEDAANKSIADIIRTDLSQKYNLPTLAAEDITANVPNRMKLYKWRGPGDKFRFGRNVEIERDDPSWKVLGGGIEASPLDLLKLGILLGDGKIISPANVKKMMTRVDPLESYALGCSHSVENGYQVMAKSGSFEGSNAYIWLVPERRMVMVVMANRDEADVSGLGRTLRSLILAQDKAAGEKPDLVVEDFERTAAPYFKDGKWEIPVRFNVVNQGKAGASNSFVNGVLVGTTYRWSGFTESLPPSGAKKLVTGIVKIPDGSKLMAGRTVELEAYADAPIAAADTSMPSWGRIDESNDANNKTKLSVKLPGSGIGLTTQTPNQPSAPSSSNPTRVTPEQPSKPTRRPTISVFPARPQVDRVPPQRTSSSTTIPARPAVLGMKSDLRITAIRFPQGQPQTAFVVVANDGPGVAGANVLRLTIRNINGTAVGRQTDVNVPAIGANKTAVITVDAASLLPNGVDLKKSTFRVDVDATSKVAETDESNNESWHKP